MLVQGPCGATCSTRAAGLHRPTDRAVPGRMPHRARSDARRLLTPAHNATPSLAPAPFARIVARYGSGGARERVGRSAADLHLRAAYGLPKRVCCSAEYHADGGMRRAAGDRGDYIARTSSPAAAGPECQTRAVYRGNRESALRRLVIAVPPSVPLQRPIWKNLKLKQGVIRMKLVFFSTSK
ncbi:hypothetical protein GUJ93_ZPchr0006g42068 [Zizania palustris]|uniref:Uncharacterized protein n=1 Tax=Zizania palustris TaxID=103762 RepID=A0A8J5VM24_ZIZPA|nr:hypothetical protein GUJ93_ZPchr0006g42068 [Zizania palustris]